MKKIKRRFIFVFIILTFATCMLISCKHEPTLEPEQPKHLIISDDESYWFKGGAWYSNEEYSGDVVTSVKVVTPKTVNFTVKFAGGSVKEGQTGDEHFKENTPISLVFENYVKKGTVEKVIDSDLMLPNGETLFSNGITSVEVEAKYDEKELILPELKKTDFTFGGYKKGDETKKAGDTITITVDTENEVLEAQWSEVPIYKLTLDNVDSAWKKGDTWYKDSECKTELPNSEVSTKQTKSYEVSLDFNGGKIEGITSPTKTTGGDFLGYFEKDSDGKPTGDASVIRADGSVAELTMTKDRELVSKFNAAKFTNPGTPTADNRTFKKWVKVNDGVAEEESVFINGETITVTEPITLKALYDWDVREININGTRYYYKENAWYTDKECTKRTTSVSQNLTTQPTDYQATLDLDNVEINGSNPGTIIATRQFNKYSDGTYDITNRSLNGLNGYNVGNTFTAIWKNPYFKEPSKPVCKDGTKIFQYWKLQGGEDKPYDFANTIATSSITLVAKWEEKQRLKISDDDVYWYKDGKWYGSPEYSDEKLGDFKVTKPEDQQGNVVVNFDGGTAISSQVGEDYFKDQTPGVIPFKNYVRKGTTEEIIGTELTLPTNGDMFKSSPIVEVEAKFDEAKTLKLPLIEKPNYKFEGYSNGSETKNAGESINVKEDTETTWKALWSEATFKLTLWKTQYSSLNYSYKNGIWYKGSECTEENRVDDNTLRPDATVSNFSVTLKAGDGTINGQKEFSLPRTFDGYYTSKVGGEKKIGTDLKFPSSINGDTVYYAHWKNDPVFEKPEEVPTPPEGKKFDRWVQVVLSEEREVAFPYKFTDWYSITLLAKYTDA